VGGLPDSLHRVSRRQGDRQPPGGPEVRAHLAQIVCSATPIALDLALLCIKFSHELVLPYFCSLSHFMAWRFGRVAQTIVIVISLLNMCIALLAEFSAMGSLFVDYVGSTRCILNILHCPLKYPKAMQIDHRYTPVNQ
jgi:hypothetical protein